MKENVKKSINRKTSIIKRKRIYMLFIDIVMLTVGAYLVSLGINAFLLPHKMSTGGASGIATILYYIANIPMGLTIIVLNVPLFIISYIKFGKESTIKTVYATALLSIFLEIFKYEIASIDILIACIFGGIISGIGLSLIFRADASSGGSDLLAQIIYSYTNTLNISQILLCIECVIILGIIIVFKDLNVGLYSIISMFISTKMIDMFFEGVNTNKVATIITKKTDKVVNAILNELNRGATITNSIGAHTGNENTIITCIISRQQISKLKNIIRQNDSKAFMYITNVNEAIGNGFKSIN